LKISSWGEQSTSSEEEENVGDNSNMQHAVWAESGAERTHFPLTGKPGIYVDLEDPCKTLEYSELICIAE
jgi:hypothetical protein